ncbi:MAG TPA: HAD family hydrolase [Candidatus Deferrimicrobium sp.]|nr:HAD family hydrolase [Candidatus Deferrimicrobium sp.]
MSDPAKILVIFDLDFTLIDNSFTICNAINYALKQFQLSAPETQKILDKIGIPLKEMFLDYLDEANAEKAVDFFREFYATHFFEGVKILPGALDLLTKLQNSGYQMAVLTSKKTEFAIQLLEHINLKQFFPLILGEEHKFRPKPDHESIFYIRSKFPSVKKVFLIGDHLVDCLAAQSAQINFIGVVTGNTSESALRKCAGKNALILKTLQSLDPKRHLI